VPKPGHRVNCHRNPTRSGERTGRRHATFIRLRFRKSPELPSVATQKTVAMPEHSDFKNYYRILGVSQADSAEEVKRAYRKLAKELHPDRHPDDAAATSKFQALNEAHAILSDPGAR